MNERYLYQTHRLSLDELTTSNPEMLRCLALAREAAKSTIPILLLGESGTGKTLLAQAIHNSSLRKSKLFVSFNASAMSDTLLESQLFGHEKGSFTGATSAVRGKFETADKGTLFFDEIADMSGLAQAKVLRAVEYGEFERVGAEVSLYADVRIVSASNRSLRKLVAEGKFREDLYYRLNGITLVVPPLRKRREDLPGLLAAELKSCASAAGKQISGIDPEAFQMLMTYSWPGNLRELHRMVQTMILFCDGDVIHPEHIAFDEDMFDEELEEKLGTATARFRVKRQSGDADDIESPTRTLGLGDDLRLETAVRSHVRDVYELCSRNKSQTARRLEITRTTLDRKLSEQ